MRFSPVRISDRPRRPKRPPRGLQDSSKTAQEAPKRAPSRPKRAQRSPKGLPRGPQDGLEALQESNKTAQRGLLGCLGRSETRTGENLKTLQKPKGFGPPWALLEGLLETSWAVLGGRKPEQAKTSKSFKNQRKIIVFCLLGLSWRASWRPLGPSWGPLDLS